MVYFAPIFSYLVILCLLFIISKHFRKTNPKYSMIDDILLFSGMPVTVGYFYFVAFNPKNDFRLVSEVMDENRPILIILMIWMVISSFIFIWRNREDKLKRL